MAVELKKATKGVPLRVTELTGDASFQRFFRHVGVRKGDTLTLITIINRHCVINIKGSRYAMEDALADHVMVENHV